MESFLLREDSLIFGGKVFIEGGFLNIWGQGLIEGRFIISIFLHLWLDIWGESFLKAKKDAADDTDDDDHADDDERGDKDQDQ